MKYCFIINPASGKAETKTGLEERISASCEAAGVDYTILHTRSALDATKLIKEVYDADPTQELRFYACGGDGTVCEVVSGVMSLENRDRVSVGVVPVGTGNDFVKNFAPLELFLDMDAQVAASEEYIDVLKCNDIYAMNMINAGFDSEVVVKTAHFKRSRFIPSSLAYVCGLAVTLIRKPGVKMSVSIDGAEPVEKKLLLTTFANGCFCGGGFHSNPLASLVDGRVDTCFIKNVSRVRFLTMVGDYKKGTHIGGKFEKIVEHVKAKEYDIIFSKPTNVSVDGEIIKMERARISVVPKALRLLIPKGTVACKECGEEVATV